MPRILIRSDLQLPVAVDLNVNGRDRRLICNVEHDVAQFEVEALRNSNVDFEIVGASNAAPATGGAAPGGSAPPASRTPAKPRPKAKRDPFDHDGKNGAGGSKKGKASTAAKGAAKKRAAKA